MTLQAELRWIVKVLACGEVLPDWYPDHALTGDLSEHRDYHPKLELILICR